MSERRKYVRWQINRKAQCRLEGAVASTTCTVHDISFMGARISIAQRLPKDTPIKIGIILANEFGCFEIEMWLVWHKRVMDTNLYGVYFTKIKDADKEKIYRFLRRDFAKEVNKQWWKDLKEEKGGEQMEDRRIFERFSTRLPLRFLNLDTGKEGTAETRDISAKGIGLVTAEQLATHAPLEIWVDVPNGSSPLYSRGEVAWSRLAKGQEYWAGINLNEADLMGVARILKAAGAQGL